MVSVLQYGHDVPGPRRPSRSPRQLLSSWSRAPWIATAIVVTATTHNNSNVDLLDSGGQAHVECTFFREFFFISCKSKREGDSKWSNSVWRWYCLGLVTWVSIHTRDRLAHKSSRSLKGWKTHTWYKSFIMNQSMEELVARTLSPRRMSDRNSSEETLVNITGRKVQGERAKLGTSCDRRLDRPEQGVRE